MSSFSTSAVAPAMHKGYLHKNARKGVMSKLPMGWNRRFFVLFDGIIYYYERHKDNFPYGERFKGCLTLKFATLLDSEQDEENMIFLTSTLEHGLIIKADSDREADEWRRVLKAHLRYYRNKHVDPYPNDSMYEPDPTVLENKRISKSLFKRELVLNPFPGYSINTERIEPDTSSISPATIHVYFSSDVEDPDLTLNVCSFVDVAPVLKGAKAASLVVNSIPVVYVGPKVTRVVGQDGRMVWTYNVLVGSCYFDSRDPKYENFRKHSSLLVSVVNSSLKESLVDRDCIFESFSQISNKSDRLDFSINTNSLVSILDYPKFDRKEFLLGGDLESSPSKKMHVNPLRVVGSEKEKEREKEKESMITISNLMASTSVISEVVVEGEEGGGGGIKVVRRDSETSSVLSSSSTLLTSSSMGTGTGIAPVSKNKKGTIRQKEVASRQGIASTPPYALETITEERRRQKVTPDMLSMLEAVVPDEDLEFIIRQAAENTSVLIGWQICTKESLVSLFSPNLVSPYVEKNLFVIMDLRKNPFNRKTEYLLVSLGPNQEEVYAWVRLNRGDKKSGYEFKLIRKII